MWTDALHYCLGTVLIPDLRIWTLLHSPQILWCVIRASETPRETWPMFVHRDILILSNVPLYRLWQHIPAEFALSNLVQAWQIPTWLRVLGEIPAVEKGCVPQTCVTVAMVHDGCQLASSKICQWQFASEIMHGPQFKLKNQQSAGNQQDQTNRSRAPSVTACDCKTVKLHFVSWRKTLKYSMPSTRKFLL